MVNINFYFIYFFSLVILTSKNEIPTCTSCGNKNYIILFILLLFCMYHGQLRVKLKIEEKEAWWWWWKKKINIYYRFSSSSFLSNWWTYRENNLEEIFVFKLFFHTLVFCSSTWIQSNFLILVKLLNQFILTLRWTQLKNTFQTRF